VGVGAPLVGLFGHAHQVVSETVLGPGDSLGQEKGSGGRRPGGGRGQDQAARKPITEAIPLSSELARVALVTLVDCPGRHLSGNRELHFIARIVWSCLLLAPFDAFSTDPPRRTVQEDSGVQVEGEMTTSIRDVMRTDLVTVNPSAMMFEAARVMSVARVGSVLVMQGDTLAGIFTERDVLRAFEHSRADLARVSPVSELMTRDPVTISPDATVGEALDRMLDGGFRHLPVMEGSTLVGVVSMRDLARSMAKG
jgi:CBS domain-containing protein